MPVDAAILATEEPIYPAICVKSGIISIFRFIPVFCEIILKKAINFCCSTGVDKYNSTNIGLICVANKYINPKTVAKDNRLDVQLNMRGGTSQWSFL